MTAETTDRASIEARLKRARSRSLYIATPIARHPCRQYTAALTRTLVYLRDHGIRAYVQTVVGNSNLPRARNELVAAFLASDYTDLLFIDDDMGWEPNDVLRLLASDKPLIGGVGSKKVFRPDQDRSKWCMRMDWTKPAEQDDFGALRVDGVGTGFMKIERRVFETLRDAHPTWKRRGWDDMPPETKLNYYAFFRFADDYDEMGEDFGFCQAWAALGGQVWVDPLIRLIHVGEHEFTGDFTALFISEPAP